MKRKVMLSLFVIFLAAAIIGGATMAWFTAKADATPAAFQAGTVMIEAGGKFDLDDEVFNNVNPGDCICVGWWITNTGSKAIELKVVGDGLWSLSEVAIEYVQANWDGLCHSKYGDFGDNSWASFMADFNTAAEMGADNNPTYIVPCPDYEWALALVDELGNLVTSTEDVSEYHFYYLGGPVEPGETVQLCLCVAFDGPLMNNLFQAATFTMGGTVYAVQASNNAPSEVWGDLYDAIMGLNPGAGQLVTAGGSFPHPYFIEFDFDSCKKPDWPLNGNGNGSSD